MFLERKVRASYRKQKREGKDFEKVYRRLLKVTFFRGWAVSVGEGQGYKIARKDLLDVDSLDSHVFIT